MQSHQRSLHITADTVSLLAFVLLVHLKQKAGYFGINFLTKKKSSISK